MKVGEWLTIGLRQFQEAYPCGWPSIYETHEQAFLSTMMGSMYGAYRVSADLQKGIITISRYQEDDKIHYVDPDRAHLYDKLPNGTYRRNEIPFHPNPTGGN
jgi:hypothetical protein